MFEHSLPKTIEFFFVLSNAVTKIVRVRIKAFRFIFFEADVRTFEIRITAWRNRNQNWLRSFLRFSADWAEKKLNFAQNSEILGQQFCPDVKLRIPPATIANWPKSFIFLTEMFSMYESCDYSKFRDVSLTYISGPVFILLQFITKQLQFSYMEEILVVKNPVIWGQLASAATFMKLAQENHYPTFGSLYSNSQ